MSVIRIPRLAILPTPIVTLISALHTWCYVDWTPKTYISKNYQALNFDNWQSSPSSMCPPPFTPFCPSYFILELWIERMFYTLLLKMHRTPSVRQLISPEIGLRCLQVLMQCTSDLLWFFNVVNGQHICGKIANVTQLGSISKVVCPPLSITPCG